MKYIIWLSIICGISASEIAPPASPLSDPSSEPRDLIFDGIQEGIPIVAGGVAACLTQDAASSVGTTIETTSECFAGPDAPGCKICRGVWKSFMRCFKKKKRS